MVRKMYAGAAVATTLNGAIAGGATSIVVTNGSTYPDGSGGPFVISIDRGLGTEEKILIASRSGNTLTVTTRGYDGSSAQAHSNLAVVEHVLDAVTIDEANRLASLLTTRGDTYYRNATDVQRLAIGANGQVYVASGVAPNTDPAWINPPVQAAAAIIEMATTPVPIPNVVDTLAYSTLHRALMFWTGTQWRLAHGRPQFLFDGYGLGAIGGGTWATISGVAGHPTVVEFRNANGVANSGVSELTNATNQEVAMPGLRHRHVFRLPTSIATRTARIGFLDTADQNDATDGMYCEIVNLTASFKTAQGGTRTTNATTAVLVAGTWYTLNIIQLTTTTARCVIVNEAGSIVLDVTNVANVPSGAQLFRVGFVVTRSDAAAVSSMLDLGEIANGYAPI